VIEHVPDPSAMISAIASKFRLGGHLVLTTPTVTRSSALVYKYLFRKLEKSTSAFESQLWAPMQVEAQKHS
jgi:2-polyprenyl-3-methyl-5-hydroxy-6-metoxy-1,4-benzoquinol methylase